MSYHNGSVDTKLECLQSIIDGYDGESLIIIGDFNAALPHLQLINHI